MRWMNYHHLLYFWTVAREGTIARACEKLLVSQPTVSGQLKALEQAVGRPLFDRSRRTLALTDMGQTVYRYAEEIFTLGRELEDVVRDRPVDRPLRLNVGAADALAKPIVRRLIEPALGLPQPVHIVCQEGKPEPLLAQLAMHEFDVVLTDAPATPGVRVRAYSHLLGECGVTFFAAASLAAKYRKRFPKSLDGAPMLLPMPNAHLRRSLDQWFDEQGLQPEVRGEFDDTALAKEFGLAGAGVFAAPSVIENEVCRQYGVRVVGRTDEVRERFYAISVERKLKHPAVLAICETAREKLFG
ncbi:MAG: transcriptional activator NhaR [Planctomycetota bacterium]|nr:MAG: transcriptional activator NhaR [Planctomycetota bacterium]